MLYVLMTTLSSACRGEISGRRKVASAVRPPPPKPVGVPSRTAGWPRANSHVKGENMADQGKFVARAKGGIWVAECHDLVTFIGSSDSVVNVNMLCDKGGEPHEIKWRLHKVIEWEVPFDWDNP